jgi:hypothetical protein
MRSAIIGSLMAGVAVSEMITLVNIFGYPNGCADEAAVQKLVFGVAGAAGGCMVVTGNPGVYMTVDCEANEARVWVTHAPTHAPSFLEEDPEEEPEGPEANPCSGTPSETHSNLDTCTESPNQWTTHQAYRCETIDSSLVELVDLRVFADGDCGGVPSLKTVVKVDTCLTQGAVGPHYKLWWANADKSQAEFRKWMGAVPCGGDAVESGIIDVAPPGTDPECSVGFAQSGGAGRQLTGSAIQATRVAGYVEPTKKAGAETVTGLLALFSAVVAAIAM